MNTATVDLNVHNETPKVTIELFIMKSLATLRSFLCSNIQLVASEFRVSNEVVFPVVIKT